MASPGEFIRATDQWVLLAVLFALLLIAEEGVISSAAGDGRPTTMTGAITTATCSPASTG